MKHYAIFFEGVRAGTIAFQDIEVGENLAIQMRALSPRVTLRLIENGDDVYCREMMAEGAHKRYTPVASGIGAQMVRQMIGKYEGHPYD